VIFRSFDALVMVVNCVHHMIHRTNDNRTFFNWLSLLALILVLLSKALCTSFTSFL